MKSFIRNSGHRQAMIFFTSSFLFLISFGAGIGMLGSNIRPMLDADEMSFGEASVLVVAGIAIFIFLAIFMAHHVLLFAYRLANSTVRVPTRNPNGNGK
jgi:hypothetical protein